MTTLPRPPRTLLLSKKRFLYTIAEDDEQQARNHERNAQKLAVVKKPSAGSSHGVRTILRKLAELYQEPCPEKKHKEKPEQEASVRSFPVVFVSAINPVQYEAYKKI